MCIKTWVKKLLRKSTRICNGDVVRTMTNEELARIISMATFKYHPRLGHGILDERLDEEKREWLEWLDKEI